MQVVLSLMENFSTIGIVVLERKLLVFKRHNYHPFMSLSFFLLLRSDDLARNPESGSIDDVGGRLSRFKTINYRILTKNDVNTLVWRNKLTLDD